MNPDEELFKIRADILSVRSASDPGEAIVAVLDLVDRLEALDAYLIAGGSLPSEWDKSPR